MPKTNIKYTTIHNWMISDLGLKGNELLVYALIYGYSNAEGQWYTANQQSLAEFCGIDRKNIYRVLNKLYDKGLIITEQVNKVGCAVTYKYKAIANNEPQNEACKNNEPQNEACNEPQNEACNEPQNEACNEPQNEAQYINNNKYIYNNNNNCPEDLNYIQGQAQFDSTEEFDNYVRECSHSSEDKEPLQIQLKKKVSDTTGLNGLDITKIVNTAAAVGKKENELLEICRYATQQNCDNLTAYILELIRNGFSKPQRNVKPNGFVSGCSQRSSAEIQRTAELLERLSQESLGRATTEE